MIVGTRSMSSEFYKYIAQDIIHYFTQNEAEIHPGERYSLVLDDETMVIGVNDALFEYTKNNDIQGEYKYPTGVYQTFTIVLHNTEIVVASKKDGMTDDFLATLRNEQLTEKCYPILMILYSPIDTIISGTGNLSAAGMPFHIHSLVTSIKKRINGGMLSTAEKILLQYELSRKAMDRFSDQSSLYEYSTILSVLGKGKVEDDDFLAFSLIPDGTLISLDNKKKIEERLNDNHAAFQEIDNVFRYGDIKEGLDRKYDSSLISQIDKRKKAKEDWYKDLTFEDVLTSAQKRQIKEKNPLEIQDILVYSGSPLEHTYEINETFFCRDDGETKASKRKKNLLVYNAEGKDCLTVEIRYTMASHAPKIRNSANISVRTQSKTVFLDFNNLSGGIFGFSELADELNGIKYVFKICILNVRPTFLGPELNAQYILNVSEKLTKPCIELQNVQDEITFNDGQDDEISYIAAEGESYSCDFEQTAKIDLPEDAFNPDTDRLNFVIKCGLIEIPIRIYNIEKKKSELTAIACYKAKFAQKTKIQYVPRTQTLVSGSTSYIVKGTFKGKLFDEWTIIRQGWLAADRNFEGDLQEKVITVPDSVRNSYRELTEQITKAGQLPSLIRYTGKFEEAGLKYVEAVRQTLMSIPQGVTLSNAQNDYLKIGCVFDEDGNIELTPLHPLNVLYQILLAKEQGVDEVRDDFSRRLTTKFLLPYLYGPNRGLYCVLDDKDAMEWRTYTRNEESRYRGLKQYVKGLVCGKIEEYKKHFYFLFDGIKNNTVCINVINMGDCAEVLNGVIKYFQKQLNSPEGVYDYFVINIYDSDRNENQFAKLRNSSQIRSIIEDNGITENVNELCELLSEHISCYFKDAGEEYQYAHLTFLEMTKTEEIGFAYSNLISTGASLNGLISGVPSVLEGEYYKTGFGMKYSTANSLMELASLYNALSCVAFQVTAFESGKSIVTTVPKNNDEGLKQIYDASNWVVFVDPKVDLSYFENTDSDDDLMIIHYSDQLSSSSSYDDITVTNKSDQYEAIIQEQLSKRGVSSTIDEVKKIIDLFNAVNGSWLLHLITAKKLTGAADSNFSREKMSILSAIKLGMAFYKHPDVVWVPLSLEEILRVSHGTGLSSNAGILSAKNLGFDNHPTCDDILFVGIRKTVDGKLKIYLHPIEVKIGLNPDTYIEKAIEQARNTYDELMKAVWPEENRNYLEYKLRRNFLLQFVIVSAEKMKLYRINDQENWDLIVDDERESLLNDNFEIADDLHELMGDGTVISFKAGTLLRDFRKDDRRNVHIIEFPEKTGSDYMVKSIESIYYDLISDEDCKNHLLTSLLPEYDIHEQPASQEDSVNEGSQSTVEKNAEYHPVIEEIHTENASESQNLETQPEKTSVSEQVTMEIKFGEDVSTGKDVIWRPNDTSQLFHTSTGIIGQSGTGKTQFTKSLITQLYQQQAYNLHGGKLGILIFDYKGDYNESKPDFVQAVHPRILKPYQLPFNPLALTLTQVFRPLLPIHVANSFKDTLSQAYGLGPKQGDALLQCIISAYHKCGIQEANQSTWQMEPPTIETVYQIYSNDDEIKKNDSLAAAMNRLHQFQIFEADAKKTTSLYDLIDGVVVIDLSGFDNDIQSFIVAITLDLFYSQMQAHGSSAVEGTMRQISKFILVDEADNFMSQDFSALKKILKEGREFGVGTILSTQLLEHFNNGDDNYAKYILTWVVHNVSDLSASDIDFVFKTASKSPEEQKLFNDIKQLKMHQSIVKIGTGNPIYMKDLPFWQLVQNDK